MAQSPATEEPDPLVLLTATLESQAQDQQRDAVVRGQEAQQFSEALRTIPEYKHVAASSPVNDLDSYYAGIVPQGSIINVFPKGSKVITGGKLPGGGSIRQEVDPRSGDIIVFEDKPTPAGQGPKQNDTKVMGAVIDSRNNLKPSFDLSTELARIKTLSGDALFDHISTTIVNVDMQLSREMQRIRETASVQSGYASARAAYDLNVQADLIAPAMQGKGVASYQTVQAKTLMDNNFTISRQLAEDLGKADSKVAELNSAKRVLGTMEIRRAQAEINKEGRKDAKAEAAEEKTRVLTSAVTPAEVANYRTLTGEVADDNTVRMAIVQRRDKDKVLGSLIDTTPENIVIKLMDPDKNVVSGALKLALAYEKAAQNSTIPPSATTTPTIDMIKRGLANPTELVKFAPTEQRAELMRKLKTPGSGKELRETMTGTMANLLGKYIENNIGGEFAGDMRKWVSVGNPDLQAAIDRTSATALNGKAPIGLVVDEYIKAKLTGPDGKPIQLRDRIAVLEAAIVTGTAAMPRSLFVTPEATDAMRLVLVNTVKDKAARAYIQAQVYTPEQRASDMGFLYSKEFGRPVSQ